jgi:hypothetical protein
MTTFGIGRADISRSIWLVVQAINMTAFLSIQFPKSHEEQHRIAKEFMAKSAAGFDCCVGAVDGILIWIGRPSEKDAARSGCGPAKFFCGRKHKFGLNCQAICDARGKFLDVSLMFPGSTSDVLSFESSSIYGRLQDGLLAPGLCLFGDNAYINARFMTTPYSGVSGGTKDSYNFYHSQLRINIECAFGRLVHRWSILRAAIPQNITIPKTTSLVIALAKLHNFCIDETDVVVKQTAVDQMNIEVTGAVPLVSSDEAGMPLPIALLHGGEHFDDVDRNARRRREREDSMTILPRERLHALIVEKCLTRPAPTRKRH